MGKIAHHSLGCAWLAHCGASVLDFLMLTHTRA